SEINALQQKSKEISVLLSEASACAAQSHKEIQELEAKKAKLVDDLTPLRLGIVRLEEALNQKNQELLKAKSEIEKLTAKHDMLVKGVSSYDEKLVDLTKLWSETLEAHKELEDLLANIRSERTRIEGSYDAYHQELKSIEIKKAAAGEKLSSLSHSIDQGQRSLAHLDSQTQAFSDQIAEIEGEELKLKEGVRQTENKIKALLKEIEETARLLTSLRGECEALSLEKRTQEMGLAQIQAEGRAWSEKLHQHELAINNAYNDLKNLCERIADRYRVELVDYVIDFHQLPLNEAHAKKEAEDLQRSLDRMGGVNENAAREFDELSGRAQFLGDQVSDLQDALCQLEGAIKKINQTTRMRFLEAFNSINRQFSQVFPRLFNGGKAELVLGDPEDLLNCGVDIIAKPPGKNIGSIDLMSGGEKALTAISLIMAIFLMKPSPFCLLDEVDAPLDEANVSRFSQLIKEISTLSQFIVITHNRKTMESADQLYGVTMEDAGMSKIVSVQVQQAFDSFKQTPPTREPTQKPTQLFFE
ncbi:MAG TPA: hypothetical protein VEL47_00445, partial [Myxococcota bacterium]|nr:hypothetical protein [Myxococcota bacterium]